MDTFSLPRNHIRVIHDGVEAETFHPLEDVSPEPDSVLFVGNTEDKNKGLRFLLEALRLLRGETPFHLTVVHRPGSHEAPRLVRELGLHGKVTFLEQLSTDELVRVYNRAQLLVSPSLYEGFGLPAAEAQACGTPVIATSAGALPEIVEDGVSGVIVPPGDSVALAKAIAELIQDPERCLQMGEAGATRIQERFSWRRTAEETLELYEEVVSRHGAARGSMRDVARPLVS